jgi:hypothetical protein
MINLTGYEIANTTIDDDDRNFLISINGIKRVSLTRYHNEIITMALRYRKLFYFVRPKQKVLIYKDRVLAKKLADAGFSPVIWTF